MTGERANLLTGNYSYSPTSHWLQTVPYPAVKPFSHRNSLFPAGGGGGGDEGGKIPISRFRKKIEKFPLSAPAASVEWRRLGWAVVMLLPWEEINYGFSTAQNHLVLCWLINWFDLIWLSSNQPNIHLQCVLILQWAWKCWMKIVHREEYPQMDCLSNRTAWKIIQIKSREEIKHITIEL
jgi:hypothetical protein